MTDTTCNALSPVSLNVPTYGEKYDTTHWHRPMKRDDAAPVAGLLNATPRSLCSSPGAARRN